ncbi:MAG: HAMP domain-containing sensor histidine kinase, partial [Campylobacterota bacterium]
QYLIQQSRLAQMGEMISMIAHQWRQPLGAISTTAVNLQMKIELEEFDLETKEGLHKYNEYFLKRLENINGYVHSLTTTIDDFRNFYKPDKKSVSVSLESVVKKALNIIKASLGNDNIEVVEDYSSTDEHEIYDGEMMQVILNILKNAQDNFREKETKHPQVIIKIDETTISICDNGGGIPKDIIGKIFDPYFSTKDEKNGTGLGLYMSKTIVEEHHKGKLLVNNINGGVCFKIELMK